MQGADVYLLLIDGSDKQHFRSFGAVLVDILPHIGGGAAAAIQLLEHHVSVFDGISLHHHRVASQLERQRSELR